jgi:hypothetical protein
MQAAAELESRFGRFDAERKSACEQLQKCFVRWGIEGGGSRLRVANST